MTKTNQIRALFLALFTFLFLIAGVTLVLLSFLFFRDSNFPCGFLVCFYVLCLFLSLLRRRLVGFVPCCCCCVYVTGLFVYYVALLVSFYFSPCVFDHIVLLATFDLERVYFCSFFSLLFLFEFRVYVYDVKHVMCGCACE